jgi:cobalt-zinc-cadmium efflux system membrane fusion protein
MRPSATSNRTIIAQPFRCLALSVIAVQALVFIGCTGSNAPTAPAAAGSQDTAELFSVPAEQMSRIRIETVSATALPRTLRLTGAVAYNGFKTTPVIPQVGGPISSVVVQPGEHVRAGQPMLFVASPDYANLRSAYLKTRAAAQLADKQYERAQDLFAHHAIAQADLEQAEAGRNQAQADLEASADTLRALGIRDPDSVAGATASRELPVIAPLDGEVVERLCSPGQLLQAGSTQCFTLSDMSTVWILANVYQNDLAFVHVGDPVTISNDTYSGVVRGKIEYLSAALDPNTRTLQARIEAQNPGERLKKDMYVDVHVRAGVIANALTVPDAAVLRDTENMPFVYVQNASNQFARRQVMVGESQDGRTQITAGLKAGEHVVGDGSLFLQFQNSLQH